MQIFLAVANEGSFTKAAEKLEYVQMSISIRIQQLEGELKTELFHRGRQGVRLTPSGEALKSYAERIIFLTQEAERVVSDSSIPRGPLRIGSLETTTAIRLPFILAEYHKSYPEVDLTLKTGTTKELIYSVLKYELDGAFVSSPGEHAELETIEVGVEELLLISARQSAGTNTPSDRIRISCWMLLPSNTRGLVAFKGHSRKNHGIRNFGGDFGMYSCRTRGFASTSLGN